MSNSYRANRFHALDGLRGLAAFGVVMTHCLIYTIDVELLHHSVFRMLMNGRCFVIFFFVLSGFVLSIGLLQSDQSYSTYFARRSLRILPPYIIAGLAAVILNWMLGSLNLHGVLDYFLLLGTKQGIALDSPSWSLVIEMRISLLMPFMCFAIVRREWATTFALVSLFAAQEVGIRFLGIGEFPRFGDTLLQSIIVTARFIICFYAGIWLAKQFLQEKQWLQRLDGVVLFLLGALAYVLLSTLLDEFSTIGAVIVIALSLRSVTLKWLLCLDPLQWLGRISYSLYLTHILVIEALLKFLPLEWPNEVKIIGIIFVSFAFAQMFYLLIEAPFIRMSRYLTHSTSANSMKPDIRRSLREAVVR